MNDFIIAEFVNNIDDIVKDPIRLTQRIKYTCCDVSKQFIVFGASSGGLYVFYRHPCSFDKLIPSSEGSVNHVSISPDEKLFAFATNKGTVCLVEINNKNAKDIQVYNEHVGNTITAMKWNEYTEELYVGDNTGKISVIINANFITKTMFQTPCSPLLQLDSKIIQIDTCRNFILVSTLSRCYLCDTEKEHYRQIGQKLRDGEFGACFFGFNNISPTTIRQQPQIHSFRILGDKETFNTLGLENLKIFCARPGLRLWEVQINGTVVRTHQFKQVINTKSDNIIPIYKNDCRLELNKNASSPTSHMINFIKMLNLTHNFILTFKKDSIYILDPINGRVILWIDKFKDIIDIKIIKNYIYVWTQKRDLHVLLFSNLEAFILKCLFNKQYLLCSDLCIKYEKQIRELIPVSSKLHLLTTLHEKLLELEELELREYILPILDSIKQHSEERKSAMKLNNGIFIIDNAHHVNNTISETPQFEPSSTTLEQTLESNKERSDNTKDIENKDIIENNNKDIEKIYEQYELDKAIGNFNSKVLIDILNNCNPQRIYDIFKALEEFAINLQSDKTDIRSWCYEKCLKYIYKKRDYNLLIFNLKLDDALWIYIKDAFISINSSSNMTCNCGYPLPNASKTVPKFYEIGCCLINKFLDTKQPHDQICYEVPHMWKHVLKSQINNDLNKILPLLIQFSDEELLDMYLKKFSFDHWNDALKMFILLKSNKCLKCEKQFPEGFEGIPWTTFATFILKSIGSETTVNLLLEHADVIPKSAFESDFYQSLIFSSVTENFQPVLRNNSIDFVKNIRDSSCKRDFEKLLEKVLQNPRTTSNLIFNKPISKMDEICSSCQMPLQTPILVKEKLIFLKCGHYYHNICYKKNKNDCILCKS